MANTARRNKPSKNKATKPSKLGKALRAGKISPEALARWVRLGEVPDTSTQAKPAPDRRGPKMITEEIPSDEQLQSSEGARLGVDAPVDRNYQIQPRGDISQITPNPVLGTPDRGPERDYQLQATPLPRAPVIRTPTRPDSPLPEEIEDKDVPYPAKPVFPELMNKAPKVPEPNDIANLETFPLIEKPHQVISVPKVNIIDEILEKFDDELPLPVGRKRGGKIKKKKTKSWNY